MLECTGRRRKGLVVEPQVQAIIEEFEAKVQQGGVLGEPSFQFQD
jgi:hypothetical protein